MYRKFERAFANGQRQVNLALQRCMNPERQSVIMAEKEKVEWKEQEDH